MTSLLVPGETLAGDGWAVEGDAYRHLFRARRLAVGDPVRLADGAGSARWAEVVAVDKKSARLRLGEV
ncbi:MAG TPA: RNA methyltransferase PUA domain-containing protein, partial [Thermoanaerobaculia bacterium]|nr:RNA methyltransferase PUA domain-containing protein [Thermoanaerobaculia bacterium]